MNQVIAKVIDNHEVAPDIFLMSLEPLNMVFSVQPGQFVMVLCGEDTLLRRPLSIHHLDDKTGKFSVLYSKVGKGTYWLSQRQPGDKIDIIGPLGNGFSILPNIQNILIIAGGMGIAPLYFLGDEAQKKGYQVTLLIGAIKANQLLEHTLKLPVKYVTATEDGSLGYHGMITDCVSEQVNSNSQVFTCGPIQMYRTLANMPILNDKPTQISLETRMGCGLGVCYGCAVRTRNGLKQVCQDGPIFNLEDIIWDDFIDSL
ncbi:dihydroorotate dehydrogenase electron transfer subunit [Chloroflexota bacterium]